MEFMTKFRAMVLDMWNYYKTREQYRTDSWNTRVYKSGLVLSSFNCALYLIAFILL
jgi:hypothetical protein